jgi:hypothetical protein
LSAFLAASGQKSPSHRKSDATCYFPVLAQANRLAPPVCSCPHTVKQISAFTGPFLLLWLDFLACSVCHFLPLCFAHLAQGSSLSCAMENRRRSSRIRWLMRKVAWKLGYTTNRQLARLRKLSRHPSNKHDPDYTQSSTMGDQEEDYSALPITDRFTHKVCSRSVLRGHGSS